MSRRILTCGLVCCCIGGNSQERYPSTFEREASKLLGGALPCMLLRAGLNCGAVFLNLLPREELSNESGFAV